MVRARISLIQDAKTERASDKESLADAGGFSDAVFEFAASFLYMMGADEEIWKRLITFFLDVTGRHLNSLSSAAVSACRCFGRLDMEIIGAVES